jgi:hypothetical protein
MSELEDYSAAAAGGMYDLPVVGRGFRETREFFDDMRPTPEDAPGVRVGKQVVRYGAVAGATTAGFAVGCIIAL